MGTAKKVFHCTAADSQSTNVAPVFTIQGTNFPIKGCDCNGGTTDSTMFFVLPGNTYASGTFDFEIYFMADTATTGQTKWGAAIAAITPAVGAGGQDLSTKAYGTETTGTLTHPGSPARVIQKITLSGVSANSAATGDMLSIRLRRLASDTTNDNLSGSVYMLFAVGTYTSV